MKPQSSSHIKEVMYMSAEVETMFYTRQKPWHGLGTMVTEAPDSKSALELAGLNWTVIQKPIKTQDGLPIPGFKANMRNTDNQVLGVVTDRYKVIQNQDAFAFTDKLLGEGVTYETAGSLREGHRTWLLAKLPQRYIISGDEMTPYLVFMNSHDGTGAIKAAMTPIRVVCMNTLLYADKYMSELGKAIDRMNKINLSDRQVYEYIDALFPLLDEPTEQQKKNLMKMKENVKLRYFEAPDLQHVGKNAYRFVNAVSDFATHAKPLRARKNYRENLFARTVDGNAMIDKAYQLVSNA